MIDAERRTVVPDLNDSHTHFIRTGINYALELRWRGAMQSSRRHRYR